MFIIVSMNKRRLNTIERKHRSFTVEMEVPSSGGDDGGCADLEMRILIAENNLLRLQLEKAGVSVSISSLFRSRVDNCVTEEEEKEEVKNHRQTTSVDALEHSEQTEHWLSSSFSYHDDDHGSRPCRYDAFERDTRDYGEAFPWSEAFLSSVTAAATDTNSSSSSSSSRTVTDEEAADNVTSSNISIIVPEKAPIRVETAAAAAATATAAELDSTDALATTMTDEKKPFWWGRDKDRKEEQARLTMHFHLASTFVLEEEPNMNDRRDGDIDEEGERTTEGGQDAMQVLLEAEAALVRFTEWAKKEDDEKSALSTRRRYKKRPFISLPAQEKNYCCERGSSCSMYQSYGRHPRT